MVKDINTSNGLLLGGTYYCKTDYNTMSRDLWKEECTSGDYFYMEALTRLNRIGECTGR